MLVWPFQIAADMDQCGLRITLSAKERGDRDMMQKLASAVVLGGLLAMPASAAEFRWAGQTDPQTMDPHAVSSAPVLGF